MARHGRKPRAARSCFPAHARFAEHRVELRAARARVDGHRAKARAFRKEHIADIGGWVLAVDN
eukprot:4162094-Alexandrium_andersonii.AAC.1